MFFQQNKNNGRMELWVRGETRKFRDGNARKRKKKAAIEWHGYRLAKYLWYRADKIKAKKNNIVKASWLLLLWLSFLLQKICFLPVSKGYICFLSSVSTSKTNHQIRINIFIRKYGRYFPSYFVNQDCKNYEIGIHRNIIL